MAKIDITYHDALRLIKDSGYNYTTDNRPDINCKQISSITMNIDLEQFPAISTKKLYFRSVVAELMWFLRGDDNIKPLVDENVNIWNKDAYNDYKKFYEQRHPDFMQNMLTLQEFVSRIKETDDLDDLGDFQAIYTYTLGDVNKNYGVQWRHFTSETFFVDQIETLIDNLRKPNPISRRHIVTAWNPSELEETPLPPCHWAFEVLPRPLWYWEKIKISGGDKIYLSTLQKEKEMKTLDKELKSLGVPNYGFELKWHQRSVDTFLGLPFNIASYAILAEIIGAITGMKPMGLIADLSNVHIYEPHMEAVDKQLRNSPMAYNEDNNLIFSERLQEDVRKYKTDSITLDDLFNNMQIDDITMSNYKSFPGINAPMFPPKK